MSLLTMCESTCTVLRPKTGKDARQGTTREPYTILVEDEPCSIQPSTPSMQLVYAQQQASVGCTVYFTRDVGIETDDVIEATETRSQKTKRFKVAGKETGLFNRMQSPWAVNCEELK